MSKTSGEKIQLTYFNIRGRGEYARLILEAAGQEYEDVRVKFEDWPALKPKTPLGFLPVLKIGDEEITQLMAVIRRLGRKLNMYGKDDKEEAQINMLIETAVDLSSDSLRSRMVKDEQEAKKILEEMVKEGYKPHFEKLEKLMKRFGGQNGWAVGSKISIADIVIFHTLELNNVHDKVDDPQYPSLKANKDAVTKHPNLAKYLQKRPAGP